MITEYCPCRKQRPLAIFTPGASKVDVLHPKAGVTALFTVGDEPGEYPGEIQEGSAKCLRLSCRLLRRS